MTFDSITNRGEFFSNHYLAAVIGGDIGGIRKVWDSVEGRDEPSGRSRLRSAGARFFGARAAASEASRSNRQPTLEGLHDVVLAALGFEPVREELAFKRNTIDLTLMPTATRVETSTGLLLVAVEAGLADSVDDLFDEAATRDPAANPSAPGLLLAPGMREGDKKAIWAAADAVGQLFSVDEPPRYVLVLGGTVVLLAERAKWAEGRFLAVDLDAALERNDTKAKGELETIAALFSADALVPGGLGDEGGASLFDDLVDKSHKHAVGVSKELRTGIRESIEILANEVIEQLDNDARAGKRKLFTRGEVDARLLTTQCLRYLYRLLVLLYAESRPELGILPTDDEAYVDGYSLDRLRELCLVDLVTDEARTGSHFDESLTRLFELVNDGYHAETAQQQFLLDAATGDRDHHMSTEQYLQFPGLDAELFDEAATGYLNGVTLRNEALQKVLRNLMVAEARRTKDQAGFISYAQLGINQLGAVYEGLMAYTGFFAAEPLFEVAKGGDPSDGTWMLPVSEADDYPDDVFVTTVNPITNQPERVRHETNSFVYRLSGRDRQRSASYYTPEVLTRCVVKHALAELLGLDDYAPENGSSGITEATELLDLTICEPALGSGAFLNEAIDQLSAEYLKRRQAELGETLDAERYNHELQKVKAHFALHQSYGVDLNATAVELAEVSLWLNAMYPGLKAPWFGLQLRRGNSLIGCRRATWTTGQLSDKPWNQTKKDKLQPPTDRKLNVELGSDEIHHFLLPGHGWAAVADRKEAKELREDEVATLKDWRKNIQKAPGKNDAERLTQLAAGVEAMWQAATQRMELNQKRLARDIDVYGWDGRPTPNYTLTRQEVENELTDPDLPTGRLRTLMDAWVGLWFWPLDTGQRPPTWDQWLEVAEELIRPDERHGLTGQLDLFADRDALLAYDERSKQAQISVAELRERHGWLDVALAAASREGAWHWDLEFAPVFARGGFDLQVGNPPWVRPRWYEDLVLAESDPWWGVTDKPPVKVQKERRAFDLGSASTQASYLAELASAEGVVEVLGSPVLRSVLAGVQTNLYMVFMDTVWRHLGERGSAGLLHPESHFTDPKAGALRRSTYGHLRRHWQFNELGRWFEEVSSPSAVFGASVYGAIGEISFSQVSNLQAIETILGSLFDDGTGAIPGIWFADGGRDLRPHQARVVTITEEVLADWARLFDEPGTPAAEARLLRPVTTADLEALSVLADQPTRLADHEYHWTRGHEEDRAKTDGTIQWETMVPPSWNDVVLQGPHFTIATPFAKQPNENCRSKGDYSEWDLEALPERVIPRTNYQRACTEDEYRSRLDHWDGKPSTESWRVAHRLMTQPGLERSLHCAILPPGPLHVHGAQSTLFKSNAEVVAWCAFKSSLALDYLTKVSGTANISDTYLQRFPFPTSSPYITPLLHRTLRLNCLTADYAPLWEELFDLAWQQDRWTDPSFDRLALGDVEATWSMDTPLRRDADRRRALVELDALAALMLGLTAEQLCAMYRTQFAVLRKYEYKMAFDAEGRKLCGYHQSAGFRQSELQDQAKAGELPPTVDAKAWSNLWTLYEQYEEDPDSVDWMDHYTAPFTRADREAEMTMAYDEFKRRHEAGDYASFG